MAVLLQAIQMEETVVLVEELGDVQGFLLEAVEILQLLLLLKVLMVVQEVQEKTAAPVVAELVLLGLM